MNDLEYPLDVSWNVDSTQEGSPSQDLLPLASQRFLASRYPTQAVHRSAQRDASLYHKGHPWVIPTTGYDRRTMVTNSRRMRNVSTPLRSTNSLSRAPVDGLMIHVEKRAGNRGMAAQVALPPCLPSETSPTARRPTNDSTMSRASSVAQSNSTSNGPVTPTVSPSYGSVQQFDKPVMASNTYDAGMGFQSRFGDGTFNQPFMPQNLSFSEQQLDIWNMPNVLPQNSMNYGIYGYSIPYGIPYQEPVVYATDEQDYGDDQQMGYQRSFTVPEQQLRSVSGKKPARKHFTPEVTNTLKTWFKENSHRPYPSEETKQDLLRQTGLTMNQLSNWFINARRRNWRRSRVARDS